MKNILKIILLIAALAVVLSVGYVLSKERHGSQEQAFCTADAKQCPDGSYVSRIPPSCDFAMCPVASSTSSESQAASSTKTFADAKQKVSFDYVDNFYAKGNLTNYIHPVEWPPQIAVTSGAFTCQAIEKKMIDGKTFCVTIASEGAAGSVYTTYTYKTRIDSKNVALTFILRMAQCANYDEPKASECEQEKKNFNVDTTMSTVFSTVKFIE
jgi:hypothetical protein